MSTLLYARYVLFGRLWNYVLIVWTLATHKEKIENRTRERVFPFNVSLDDASLYAAADAACKHVFNLLGSGDTFVGDPIDWAGSLFKEGRRDIK